MKAYSRLIADAAPTSSTSSRTISFTFATPNIARDGHRIMPGAWQSRGHDGLMNFRASPVFLWAHDMTQPPVGKVSSLAEKDGFLRGVVTFAETPFAEEIFQLYGGGFMRGASVSWIPVESKRGAGPNREPGALDFTKVELLEISAVPVGCDPDALAEARGLGLTLSSLGAWADQAAHASNVTLRENALALTRALSTAANVSASPSTIETRRAYAQAKRGGFRSFGEWARAVIDAGDNFVTDHRLLRAPSGAGEVDPTSGGFAVPDEFISDLVGSLYAESVLAPLCDRHERENGRPVKRPMIDETSRVDGSRWGGVKVLWKEEAATVSSTLPRLKQYEFQPHSLLGYCVVSNELAGDAPMLGSYLTRAFGSEMSFVLDRAILLGKGAGQPLGILNTPSLISVAAEGGQSAATIVRENIQKMWQRLPAPSRRRAVWIVNEDASHELDRPDSSGGWAGVFVQPSNGERFARLKGAPVLELEQAPALGTLGDIVLADLSQYILVENYAMAISGHAQFLNDQLVFRFRMRVDGAPAWSSPITPYNGTQTRSPFVALAAR
ncbi:MAG TPA: phage major capsid protein [Methylosinus sp.]|jgi:HK97 family phage major capsid protein/HK97 family phage prohead protease|uniref:phage major capsid protein n=1 Tax=Methylosinus sp. TaxID=427 RepID=UPI002F92FDE4